MELFGNIKIKASFTCWHSPGSLKGNKVDRVLFQEALDRFKTHLLRYSIITAYKIGFNFMLEAYNEHRAQSSNSHRYELKFVDRVASPQQIFANAMIMRLWCKRFEKMQEVIDTVRDTSAGRIIFKQDKYIEVRTEWRYSGKCLLTLVAIGNKWSASTK